MVIIGITGTLGAGKGTLVEYLVRVKGFLHFSVREYLIQEIENRGMTVDRDSMVTVANDLRTSHNPAFIIEQLYQRAKASGKNCIIESIRTPGEAESLKKTGNFYLLAVDADPSRRYRRIRIRASETDRISYETFLDNEEREMSSTDPNHQNIARCIEMADFVLENNKTIRDLHKQLEEILRKILT